MEMLSQGCIGTSKGWYRPCFLLLGLLVQQSMHPLMNLATYSCILGQYTYTYKLSTVFSTPKCYVALEVWASLINGNLSFLGTHSLSNL